MDISVDLPAPFSPTMPWIVPEGTTSEMSRLACTGPKALEIPRSSIAGGAVPWLPGRAMGRQSAGQLLSDM